MRIDNVFHADRLRKAAKEGLPGQHLDPPLPIPIDGEPEYEVAEVLSSKTLRKKLHYRVS